MLTPEHGSLRLIKQLGITAERRFHCWTWCRIIPQTLNSLQMRIHYLRWLVIWKSVMNWLFSRTQFFHQIKMGRTRRRFRRFSIPHRYYHPPPKGSGTSVYRKLRRKSHRITEHLFIENFFGQNRSWMAGHGFSSLRCKIDSDCEWYKKLTPLNNWDGKWSCQIPDLMAFSLLRGLRVG
jgi:hypothetical protein